MLLISGSAVEIRCCMQFNKLFIFDYRPRQANRVILKGKKNFTCRKAYKGRAESKCTVHIFYFFTFNSNKRNLNSKYIANLLILHVVHIRCISLYVE